MVLIVRLKWLAKVVVLAIPNRSTSDFRTKSLLPNLTMLLGCCLAGRDGGNGLQLNWFVKP